MEDMKDAFVIHYSEIGIKGKNRGFFEKHLQSNLKSLVGDQAEIDRTSGRFFAIPTAGTELDSLWEKFARTPGVAYFAKGRMAELDLEEITRISIEVIESQRIKTFGVKTRRSNKKFPYKSNDVSRHVGAAVVEKLGLSVDLTDPDRWLVIEINNGDAFIYVDRRQGIGGLPVGSSGRVISSLSGGIDSPVAAQMMMKRGCPVTFAHVRNENQYSHDVEDKVKRLAEALSAYQPRTRLHILPFGELQKQIIIFVPSKFRMIIYRRFMMRLLNRIAAKENALGIVTGDSMGQVASQTLENIRCIQDASTLPVIAPLMGMNKEEIVKLSKEIGTFDLSVEPYPDCCSFMIAPHPETRANLEFIRKCERAIEGADELVDECLVQASTMTF